MSDSTLVTGSPFAAQGPTKGSVLGERWEVRDLEEADALFLTMRAVDQESDAVVLMRLVAPGLLGDRDARLMAERLKKLVGKGGPSINVLRDVDREGATLFSVEPYPTGASFRSVLEARRQKGQALTPAEILPVVARLESALSGIPDPYFHGDLRPQRIFVAPERVLVTGGFFLPVMPGDPLVDALSRDIPLRRQFAPEVGDGLAGRPSDRWSIAALVWEALVGSAPQPGPKSPPPKLGAVGAVLLRYLDPDPAQRPPSLGPLIDALAAAAGVARPPTAPEPFGLSVEEASSEATLLAGRPSADTGEIAGPKTEPGVNDTVRLPALGEDGKALKPKRDLEGIDPALLQAAAAARKISDSGTFELDGVELERLKKAETGKPEGARKTRSNPPAGTSSDLDPRLVRAALGVSAEPTSDATDTRAHKSGRPPPKRSAGTTQELDASEMQIVPSPTAHKGLVASKAATSAPKRSIPAPAAKPPRAASAPAAVAPKVAERPSAPTPIRAEPPRPSAPRAAPAMQPRVQPLPQPMQPRVQPAPKPPAPAVGAADARLPGNAPASPVAAPVAQPGAFRAVAAPRPAAGGPSGTAIVASAVIVALLILAAALGYRHWQDAAERERRLEERLRSLPHRS